MMATLVHGSSRAQCWLEGDRLEPNNPKSGQFGFSVAVHGAAAVIGEPWDNNANGSAAGSVHFFALDLGRGSWKKVVKHVVENGDGGDRLGWSACMDGNTAVAGAPFGGPSLTGAAYVYERDWGGTGNWGQIATLLALVGTAGDSFGSSVAIASDTIVVGAPSSDTLGFSSGTAHLFERDLGGLNVWGELIELAASDGGAEAVFGESVAIHGDTVAIGAPSGQGTSVQGAVYIFERNLGGANQWGERTKITASDGQLDDLFGTSVSLYEDTLVVGASRHAGGGAAYVFERHLGGRDAWGEHMVMQGPAGGPSGGYGEAVCVFGDTIAVGAPSEAIGVTYPPGAIHLYERNLGGPEQWGQIAHLVESGNGLGMALSMQGETLFGGAPYDSYGGKSTPGSVQTYARGSQAMRYCTAGTSASGCRAFVTACGTPSATLASGFVLAAQDVEGSANGLFFFGSSGRQANPWGNGTSFQCVAPPVHRAGTLIGKGPSGTCEGSFSQDLNARWCPSCPKAHHNPGVGATVQAQLWYRDPQSSSNQTTALSDAVEFTMLP